MDRLIGHTIEPMHPEWFTVKQFAKHYGLGQATAYRKLMELVDGGKLECWYGISFVSRRMLRKFRLKQKKNEPSTPSPQAPEATSEVYPPDNPEWPRAAAQRPEAESCSASPES